MIESSSNMVVESGGNLRRRGGGAVTLEEVGLGDEGLRERRIQYDEKKGSGIQRFYRLDGSIGRGLAEAMRRLQPQQAACTLDGSSPLVRIKAALSAHFSRISRTEYKQANTRRTNMRPKHRGRANA